jgi:hypothetical protein
MYAFVRLQPFDSMDLRIIDQVHINVLTFVVR